MVGHKVVRFKAVGVKVVRDKVVGVKVVGAKVFGIKVRMTKFEDRRIGRFRISGVWTLLLPSMYRRRESQSKTN